MKQKLLRIRVACVALSLSLGLSLSACGKSDGDKTFKTEEYYIVFVDGKPYLTQPSGLNLIEIMSGSGNLDFTDVNSNEIIGVFSNSYELNNEPQFSNEKGEKITKFSIVPCNKIISTDTFTPEIYNFLSNDSEKVSDYIKEKYLYDVKLDTIINREFEDEKTIVTYLGIYKFDNTLTGEVTYHIGYNASRVDTCDYVYDIQDNKIYHKPEIGSYTFIAIHTLYDGDQITASEAISLMNEYINSQKPKEYQKN